MISDASIKKALSGAAKSGKSTIELKDDGPRGEGRLALIIRVAKNRITSEWYAVWWRDGRRRLAKIGTYPTMSLADARRDFTAEYAPAIARREQPEKPKARRVVMGITVKDLFQAYVDDLRAKQKPSLRNAERVLLLAGKDGKDSAAKLLGERKRAADVTPQDIIPILSKIHERGSETMAITTRAYIGAAFAYAMASENSYTRAAGAVQWGIRANPVLAIPAESAGQRVGQRFLNQAEFCDFWSWLLDQDGRSLAAPGARLIMATGQRISEIMRVTDRMWSPSEAMIDWGKTKNGKPHNLPLPDQGVEIMSVLVPNKHGLYFPSQDDAEQPMTVGVQKLVERYREDHPEVPHFTARDLRRTWKTLSGAAGISKEMRDRLQNHARSDVSSRHYDRWEMLPERRAAMAVWSKYLARIIAGEFKDNVVQLPAAEVG